MSEDTKSRIKNPEELIAMIDDDIYQPDYPREMLVREVVELRAEVASLRSDLGKVARERESLVTSTDPGWYAMEDGCTAGPCETQARARARLAKKLGWRISATADSLTWEVKR